jgi:hypothetical protein
MNQIIKIFFLYKYGTEDFKFFSTLNKEIKIIQWMKQFIKRRFNLSYYIN